MFKPLKNTEIFFWRDADGDYVPSPLPSDPSRDRNFSLSLFSPQPLTVGKRKHREIREKGALTVYSL